MRWARLGTAVLVVLAAAITVRYIAVTWVDRMDVNAVLPYSNLLMSDFRDAVWLPAGDVLAGHDPYDDAAFVTRHPGTQGYSPYTPAHLMVTLGLGTLSWTTGTLVWAVLGGIALAAMGAWAGVATLRFARPSAGRLECVAAAAAGVLLVWIWRPSSTAIGLGQPTSVYGPAAAVAAAATVIAVGLPNWARTVLSFLAICKPQTGIQLAIAAAAARQWRALVGGFVIACVLSLAVATWIAGGPGSVVGWVLALPAAVAGHHSRFDQRYTTGNPWIDVMSTAHRLGLPDFAGPLLAVLLLVVGVAAAMALRRRGLPALGALTAMTVGLLVVPHCGYDVLLLLPVLMLAVVETWRMPARALAVAALVPLTLSGLIPNFRLPLMPEGLEPALGQAVLLLVGLGLLLVLARSVPARAPAEPVAVGGV